MRTFNFKHSLNLIFILFAITLTSEWAFADSDELQKIDVKVGHGEEAEVGKTVNVHYTGWLYDENAADKKGKKFDSSHDRKEPFSFMLGHSLTPRGLPRHHSLYLIHGPGFFLICAGIDRSASCLSTF